MNFLYGLKRGIPVGLSYLAVSFAFGVFATTGLTPLMAVIMSLTNLTSSGQYAGVKIIIENGSYIEIAVTVLLINLRYSLMSISMSQKLEDNFSTWKRLIVGFGVADEVYAVAMTERGKLTFSYLLGLISLPLLGWTLGTAIGAYGSTLIGPRLLEALNLAIYAMFIGIIMPDIKKNYRVLIVCLISISLSCAFYFIPGIKEINIGLKIIISTILAAVFGALVFPKNIDNMEVNENV